MLVLQVMNAEMRRPGYEATTMYSTINSSNILHPSTTTRIAYLNCPPAGVISSVQVPAPLPTAVPPVSFCGNHRATHAQVPGAV